MNRPFSHMSFACTSLCAILLSGMPSAFARIPTDDREATRIVVQRDLAGISGGQLNGKKASAGEVKKYVLADQASPYGNTVKIGDKVLPIAPGEHPIDVLFKALGDGKVTEKDMKVVPTSVP